MAKHLRITGIVQGVGYRAAFARKAEALKICGWVRNRHDGTVEAMVSGASDALDTLIAWAHLGPSGAQVKSVSVTEAADMSAGVRQFEILSTE